MMAAPAHMVFRPAYNCAYIHMTNLIYFLARFI